MSEYIKKEDAFTAIEKGLPYMCYDECGNERATWLSIKDIVNGLPTYSFPDREKEIEAIEEAEAIVKAFKYSLEALDERLEDYEHEQELLEQDMKEGVRGVGATRHCVELSTKKKLISEVLCFMTQAIEDAKKGDI